MATRGQRIRQRLLGRYRLVRERRRVVAQRGWQAFSPTPAPMGDVPVFVRDSFNRNDNAASLGNAETGQAWTTTGAGVWGISGNQAYRDSAAAEDVAVVDAGVANCTVEATFVVIAGAMRMCWRFTNQANMFIVTNEGVQYTIFRKEANAFTSLGSYVVVPTNGDRIKVSLNGSTHRLYVNDVLGLTVTDTFQQTASSHGLTHGGVDVTPRWDDFLVKGL